MKPDIQEEAGEELLIWTLNPLMLQQLSPQQRAAMNLPLTALDPCGPGG